MSNAKLFYRAFLKEAKSFSNYNLREYIKRRVKHGFMSNANVSDPEALKSLYSKAQEDLILVKRQSILYSLYGRRVKNVVEVSNLGL
eukprot:CAMPEP_0175057694 /NCGR_PEP_ID=MMETSP0052_2-20121109/11407_1 /TAXON_ID=51329 ORGANISM="Polytomella parva, Strain SAG 63-3" /NCGR_SAMPLE_ID=MMETSP0052_2 /ASSEMBLY_ACC=CAM_ASM_000194 /LENGTH=86 /DNA_ID=CAMNT_0016322937 /DNA_START=20 /DNA_END=280 /DNA_ORIENTATION=+